MKTVDTELLKWDKRIQLQLWDLAIKYEKLNDARWMFAFAHFRITQQINDTIDKSPWLFRDPNQLIRFNISFATAFLAAMANQATPPWKKAFSECRSAERVEPFAKGACLVVAPLGCHLTEDSAVKVCAIAMANAHINTDIVNSLRTIGCIDKNDYGNILLFVEKGARDAIVRLHGRLEGPVYNDLKQTLLPLDKIWRNAVYEQVCHDTVPDIEPIFRQTVERNSQAMLNVKEGLF